MTDAPSSEANAKLKLEAFFKTQPAHGRCTAREYTEIRQCLETYPRLAKTRYCSCIDKSNSCYPFNFFYLSDLETVKAVYRLWPDAVRTKVQGWYGGDGNTYLHNAIRTRAPETVILFHIQISLVDVGREDDFHDLPIHLLLCGPTTEGVSPKIIHKLANLRPASLVKNASSGFSPLNSLFMGGYGLDVLERLVEKVPNQSSFSLKGDLRKFGQDEIKAFNLLLPKLEYLYFHLDSGASSTWTEEQFIRIVCNMLLRNYPTLRKLHVLLPREFLLNSENAQKTLQLALSQNRTCDHSLELILSERPGVDREEKDELAEELLKCSKCVRVIQQGLYARDALDYLTLTSFSLADCLPLLELLSSAKSPRSLHIIDMGIAAPRHDCSLDFRQGRVQVLSLDISSNEFLGLLPYLARIPMLKRFTCYQCCGTLFDDGDDSDNNQCQELAELLMRQPMLEFLHLSIPHNKTYLLELYGRVIADTMANYALNLTEVQYPFGDLPSSYECAGMFGTSIDSASNQGEMKRPPLFRIEYYTTLNRLGRSIIQRASMNDFLLQLGMAPERATPYVNELSILFGLLREHPDKWLQENSRREED